MNDESVTEAQPLHLVGGFVDVPESALSLFLARHGVGKSAVLINLALDQLIDGKQVLHFTTGMTSEKTHQYYKELFQEYSRHYSTYGKSWDDIYHNFTVVSYMETANMIDDLENEMHTIVDNANLHPSLVILDGLEASEQTVHDLARIKAVAQEHHARFAAAMVIHRHSNGAIDFDRPLAMAKENARNVFWLEPSPQNDRVNIDLMSDADHAIPLRVYFCPHDFIFKHS